jgi:hypothetical protein
MSTSSDIWEVYRDEIANKSRLVYRKGGAKPFFTDDNLRIETSFQVPDPDFIDSDWLKVAMEDMYAGSIRERAKEKGD